MPELAPALLHCAERASTNLLRPESYIRRARSKTAFGGNGCRLSGEGVEKLHLSDGLAADSLLLRHGRTDD
ncbi:hypothetical protein Q4543_03260, partial [Salipiger sp. 1_MG-2023]|uniref:hypothetical protein n=1 Tax=Salipiger sp. 1_MG-2023 TaxID=3062665 RepID=UPI0026E3DB28